MNLSFLDSLNLKILSNEPLKNHTTFQMGGATPALIVCQTSSELIQTVQALASHNIPFLLIGGGSNIVPSDQGVDCVVIRYQSDTPLVEQNDQTITVNASTNLDDLVVYCVENALEGLNYCSGIPGTVGGAIVGNAGAFGKQIGDVLMSAVLLSSDGQTQTVSPDNLNFTYRHSRLKESNDIVVSASFQLKQGDSVALSQERMEILKTRHAKHPDLSTTPCAGSFFRNIEPTSKAERRQATGWFLDQAGGKSLRVGGAAIFDKHANIIVKQENCTSNNIYQLSQKMAALARDHFDLNLIREVRFLGKLPGVKESQERFW